MMRRYGLPVLPGIIGVILGPFAEQELRQALQISNGDVGGLFEPISVVVYSIVALILLWPVVRKLLPRKAVPEVLAEAAHEIEESHHQHGLTTAVSVERHPGHEGHSDARSPSAVKGQDEGPPGVT